MSISVDRFDRLEEGRFLNDYANASKPVILSKACAAWPAMQAWNLESLKQRAGQTPVRFGDRDTNLATVLDAVSHSSGDAPAPYLIECYLHQSLPQLLPDVLPIPFSGSNRVNHFLVPAHNVGRLGHPELLIGGLGTRFPILHYDLMHKHALITQIQGDKHFWLYPPDQTSKLYPRPEAPNLSRIDRFDPVDPVRWPLYYQAQAVEVVLHAGETIFIPSGWWHRTQLLSTSVAVTWNYVTRANWKAYVEDKFLVWTRHSKLRTALKSAYLGAVGAYLNLREAIAY